MKKNTWKFLNRAQKNAIDCVDEADMEEALRRDYFNNFIWMYDTLSNILQEGHCRLNEDQSSVLLLPIKKWGTKAGRVLYEMRRDLWVQIKKDRAAA